MNRRGDEFGEVLDVIATATRFMREYDGEVVDDQDPLARGRVRLTVPELGWTLQSEAPWVEPEMGAVSLVVPAVGSYVSVRFQGADGSRPVYRGRVGLGRAVSSSFTGPDDVVLVEDSGVTVRLSRSSRAVSIEGASYVSVNGDSLRVVTYEALNAALQALVVALNAALAAKLDGAGASPALTLDVSGAASSYLKVGG